jgi:CRP-like cAMP-binding protein
LDRSRAFTVPGQNRLLSALPRDAQIGLLPRLEKTSLAVRQVLYEPDAALSHVYFPLSGVVSLIMQLKGGESVEIGTVGNEGIVGTPVVLGDERSPCRALSQVAGQAVRMRVADFRQSLEEHAEFGHLVRRYTQGLFNQRLPAREQGP